VTALVRCNFCQGTGRPPREPVQHAARCPFSDYLRGCRLCSAIQDTPHKPTCPYLVGTPDEIKAAEARLDRVERIARGPR